MKLDFSHVDILAASTRTAG